MVQVQVRLSPFFDADTPVKLKLKHTSKAVEYVTAEYWPPTD